MLVIWIRLVRNFFLDSDPELFVSELDPSKIEEKRQIRIGYQTCTSFALVVQKIQRNVPIKVYVKVC